MAKPKQDPLRQRRAVIVKQFVPSPGWITQNVVAKGKGTQVAVGRVMGVVFGYEEKTDIAKDGSSVFSVVLNGAFETLSYVTGEKGQATSAYLPVEFALLLAKYFDANTRAVELDCDVSLESKGAGYQWKVDNASMIDVLDKLRDKRGRPKNAAKLLESINT